MNDFAFSYIPLWKKIYIPPYNIEIMNARYKHHLKYKYFKWFLYFFFKQC